MSRAHYGTKGSKRLARLVVHGVDSTLIGFPACPAPRVIIIRRLPLIACRSDSERRTNASSHDIGVDVPANAAGRRQILESEWGGRAPGRALPRVAMGREG